MTTKTTASSVAATLRRAGFNPASPSDHHREGIKAKQSGDRVRVYADLDSEEAATRMATDAHAVLTSLGYYTSEISEGAFYASRP